MNAIVLSAVEVALLAPKSSTTLNSIKSLNLEEFAVRRMLIVCILRRVSLIISILQ